MIRSGASSNLVLSSLAFEYGCDAMILLDSELTVRALNPAAQALLGWRPDQAVSYGAGLPPGTRAPSWQWQVRPLPL